MKTKQLGVNCKIILGTILIAIFGVIISEIDIRFYPTLDRSEETLRLVSDGLRIIIWSGLMIWRYKQHSQIIAFLLKNLWQQYCWGLYDRFILVYYSLANSSAE